MEWISVEEYEPHNTNEVLITNGYDYTVAWFRISDKTWVISIDAFEVVGDAFARLDMTPTHWMPLPSPPE